MEKIDLKVWKISQQNYYYILNIKTSCKFLQVDFLDSQKASEDFEKDFSNPQIKPFQSV